MLRIFYILTFVYFASCSSKNANYYHPTERDTGSNTAITSESYSRSRLNKESLSGKPEAEPPAEQLKEYANNWFYGRGMGKTLANVGTVAVFPPYAFYIVGNAGLSLMGYDPLLISDALPDPTREPVLKVYNGVTSVPGRISAKIAGEEFRESNERE